MNIALKQLHEGLKWADADVDPKWYGMGDAAHAAMLRFPPFIEWRKENPEEEIDDAALAFARTPEFEKFLMGMFPKELITLDDVKAAEKAAGEDGTLEDRVARVYEQLLQVHGPEALAEAGAPDGRKLPLTFATWWMRLACAAIEKGE